MTDITLQAFVGVIISQSVLCSVIGIFVYIGIAIILFSSDF